MFELVFAGWFVCLFLLWKYFNWLSNVGKLSVTYETHRDDFYRLNMKCVFDYKFKMEI